MSSLGNMFADALNPELPDMSLDPSKAMLGAEGNRPMTGGASGPTPTQMDFLGESIYGFTPVGKMQDALGLSHTDGWRFNRSLVENLKRGNYGQAGYQAAGVALPAIGLWRLLRQ